jgi:glutamate racemase
MKFSLFDSGIGGLTVLKELYDEYPEGIEFSYFGDTGRVPYGSKSTEILKKQLFQIFDFIKKLKPDLVVSACNTSDSVMDDSILEFLGIQYIGIIDSVINYFVDDINKDSSIGIIGTEQTVKKSLYLKKIVSKCNAKFIVQKACPLFVPLVEEGNWSGTVVDTIVRFYLKRIKKIDVDFLILGCTHYPFLYNSIKKYLDSTTKIIDPAKYISKRINIDRGELSKDKSIVNFYVSGDTSSFKRNVDNYFKNNLNYNIYYVDVSEEKIKIIKKVF